jgi:uncharacterized membrane protein
MTQQTQYKPTPVTTTLAFADLRRALGAGWQDFRARPQFGLLFASIYVVAGLVLFNAFFTRNALSWLITAIAGFPLIAPFIAVGLYEVSRRREAGQTITWPAVLGTMAGRGNEQVLMIGGFVFVGFTFWMIIAHGIFAIFMSGISGAESLEALATPTGLAMLGVGSVVGAAIAFLFYSITVISLPMLVDRDVDFLTAMFASMRTVQANTLVMLGWAVFVALALFVAMLPYFLGLLVVLPVLAHATWHLYRRVVG